MQENLLQRRKGSKIIMLTAYDYPTAKLLVEAGVDWILVGDSLGVVFQGKSDTKSVSMEQMVYHTQIVSRGAGKIPVIADMPIDSYNNPQDACHNALRLKEAGAQAVKLEGYRPGIIKALREKGIEVMGHLGVLPQTAKEYKVSGKNPEEAKALYNEALNLVEEGVFAIVLECMPENLARQITEVVKVPTIGIGAGKYCDGQVLVINDLLGLNFGHIPKFVKMYTDLKAIIKEAVSSFKKEVQADIYPDEPHTYH